MDNSRTEYNIRNKNITIFIQIHSNKMVLLHYKKTDHNQFLYEAPAATPVNELLQALVDSTPSLT